LYNLNNKVFEEIVKTYITKEQLIDLLQNYLFQHADDWDDVYHHLIGYITYEQWQQIKATYENDPVAIKMIKKMADDYDEWYGDFLYRHLFGYHDEEEVEIAKSLSLA